MFKFLRIKKEALLLVLCFFFRNTFHANKGNRKIPAPVKFNESIRTMKIQLASLLTLKQSGMHLVTSKQLSKKRKKTEVKKLKRYVMKIQI